MPKRHADAPHRNNLRLAHHKHGYPVYYLQSEVYPAPLLKTRTDGALRSQATGQARTVPLTVLIAPHNAKYPSAATFFSNPQETNLPYHGSTSRTHRAHVLLLVFLSSS